MPNKFIDRYRKYVDEYLERGFYLIPLAPGEKRPHPKYAPDGLDNATRDLKVIGEWPDDINLGILTGPESGIAVLDTDIDKETGEHVGENAIKAFLDARKASLPKTFTVLTRSGGLHRFLKILPGVKIKARNDVLSKVDIKSDRGYVVAPPSRIDPPAPGMGTGVYEIVDNGPIADAPEWFVELSHMEKADGVKKSENAKTTSKPQVGSFPLADDAKIKLKDIFLDVYDPSYGFGHDVLLAFFGSLAHRGVPLKDTLEIVALADKTKHITGDFERQAKSTYDAYEEDKEVVGLTTFKEIVSRHPDKYPADLLQRIDDVYDSVFPPMHDPEQRIIWEYYIDGNPDTLTSTRVVCTEEGVFIVAKKLTRKGDTYEQPTPVFGRPLILDRIGVLDGDEPTNCEFQFHLGDDIYMGTKDEVVANIKSRGMTGVGKKNIDDVIMACVSHNDKYGTVRKETWYDAVGVYWREGHWDYVLDNAVNKPGKDAWLVSHYFKKYGGDPRVDLAKINQIPDFYQNKDDFAYLLGWALAAPFSYALKGKDDFFFPVVILKGPAATGKTALAELLTTRLFGVPPGDPDQMTAEYRLLAYLGRSTLPSSIDEAQDGVLGNDPRSLKLLSLLKESAGKQIVGNRGNPDQTKTIYYAKSPLILAGNRLNVQDQALLARMMIIRFDGSQAISSSARRRFTALLTSIEKGVGQVFIQYVIENYTLDDLYAKIKSFEIDYDFADPRREDYYSISHLFLSLFSDFLQKNGIQFKLREYLDADNFMSFVARMEQKNTDEREDLQVIDRFAEALQHQLAVVEQTRDQKNLSIQWHNLDEMAEKFIDPLDGKIYANVTQKAIDMAIRDKVLPEGTNLADVGAMLADRTKLPLSFFYSRKAKKIKNKIVKIVKVPLYNLQRGSVVGVLVGNKKDGVEERLADVSLDKYEDRSDGSSPPTAPSESGGKLIRVRLLADFPGDKSLHIPPMGKGDTFYKPREVVDDLVGRGIVEVVQPRIPGVTDRDEEVEK